MVGTGGPVQNVHHSGQHYNQGQRTSTDDFDAITAHDRQKYGDRGDQPGYLITPGQLGNKHNLLNLISLFIFLKICCLNDLI